MVYLSRLLLIWCCCQSLPSVVAASQGLDESSVPSVRMWERLLTEAERLRLPTKFLKKVPPDFIRFEFDDLHTYAAEYHPGERRLILNRSLSLNGAGATLKPLGKLTHKELDLLYHELFHAYMDYLALEAEGSSRLDGESRQLMDFARSQQTCRYSEVVIAPVIQRKEETESRYLSETESWEALNETWAVFICWAIWNQLEVERNGGGSLMQHRSQIDQWSQRLEVAFRNGDLRGYYSPEDPEERRTTQKRFLAKESQLSWTEARVLMIEVIGFPGKVVERLQKRPGISRQLQPPFKCRDESER